MIKHYKPVISPLAFLAVLATASTVQAQPGPAPAGTSIADYDSSTGRIVVSVNGVNNWIVNSDSMGMTGPDGPSPPLPLGSGSNLVSDSDFRVGETGLGVFTYTDVDLGLVAAPGLPLGDLIIFWNTGTGTPLEQQPVDYIGGQLGDHDGDGDVDGRDFLLAQAEDGVTTDVEENFGANVGPLGASIAAVPEPASLLLFAMAGFALATSRRRN